MIVLRWLNSPKNDTFPFALEFAILRQTPESNRMAHKPLNFHGIPFKHCPYACSKPNPNPGPLCTYIVLYTHVHGTMIKGFWPYTLNIIITNNYIIILIVKTSRLTWYPPSSRIVGLHYPIRMGFPNCKVKG